MSEQIKQVVANLCAQLERIADVCVTSGQHQAFHDLIAQIDLPNAKVHPDLLAPLVAAAATQTERLEAANVGRGPASHKLDLVGGLTLKITEFVSPPPQRRAKSYPVGLVGEQRFQEAIGTCREADGVSIVHEIGNPFDEHALVAVTAAGSRIGYVPRDNWLRGATFEQGLGNKATIKSITSGAEGNMEVILNVATSGDSLRSMRADD